MRADLDAPLGRRVDGRLELVPRHQPEVRGIACPMAAGGEDLDDLRSVFDLLSHCAAKCLGAIAHVHSALCAHIPIRWKAKIVAVAGGADIAAAGHDSWTFGGSLGDGG